MFYARVAIAFALILLAIPSNPQGGSQPDSDTQAILARSTELNEAFLHSDIRLLEGIIADDCLQITQNGSATKTEWIAPYRNGTRHVESITALVWPTVRFYGDVALAISTEDWVVNVQGEPRTFRLFQTRTWVKRSGRWYLVLMQNTPRAAETVPHNQ